jgi:hypothetical protein
MPKLTVTIALCSGVLLAGCYGSKGQTKMGQSHWLERCSTSSDCIDDQICVCGVCTIECGADAACGSRGTCAALDDIAECSAPASIEQVCLQRCGEDDDCGASGIECIERTCVVTTPGGGGPIEDGGVPADSNGLIDTLEGPLTCSEIRRREEVLNDAHKAQDSLGCEIAQDCSCINTSTACSAECSYSAVTWESSTQYIMDIEQFSMSYCFAPNVAEACAATLECADADDCMVNCVSGRCILTERKRCFPGVSSACSDDEICHIDESCIPRNTSDENGVETLAIGKQLGDTGQLSSWGNIVDVAVTDSTIFWLDAGTSQFVDVAPTDGAVFQLGLGAFEAESLTPVSYLANEIAADADYVYVHAAGNLFVVALAGDAAGSVNLGGMTVPSPWTIAGGGIVYLARGGGNVVERFDVVSDTATEVAVLADDLEIVSLAAEGNTLFVETNVFGASTTTLHTVDIDTAAETVLVETFRNYEANAPPPIVHEGRVLSTDTNGELRGHAIDSGEPVVYASDALLRSAYAGAAYYVSHDASEDARYPYSVVRVDLASGASEVVLRTIFEVGDVIEQGNQLLWVENARLLRKRRITSTPE